MKTNDLEALQRARESFHGLRVLPGAWPVIRVDGRSFTRFTEIRFTKPFDERFSEHMLTASRALLEELGGIYAFTESDEISVLLPRTTDLFDRSVEKLISLSAGIASSIFTLSCGEAAHFDSRLWVGASDRDVIDYFSWRQADAARCGLNGWAYWTLRKSGLNATETTARLAGMRSTDKHELLFSHGINFNDLPAWQRRGSGVLWETYDKPGWNPQTETEVVVQRRQIVVNQDLPIKDVYREWIAGRLAST